MQTFNATVPQVPLTWSRLQMARKNRQIQRLRWERILYGAFGPPYGPYRNRNKIDCLCVPRRLDIQLTITREAQESPESVAGAVDPLLKALKNLGWIYEYSPEWWSLRVVQIKGPHIDQKIELRLAYGADQEADGQ